MTGQCLIQKVHGDLMKDGEVFFVKVKEPSQVRKDVLESLKDIVENHHRFEKFRSLREEKQDYLNKLRNDVKQLMKFMNSLQAISNNSKINGGYYEEFYKSIFGWKKRKSVMSALVVLCGHGVGKGIKPGVALPLFAESLA